MYAHVYFLCSYIFNNQVPSFTCDHASWDNVLFDAYLALGVFKKFILLSQSSSAACTVGDKSGRVQRGTSAQRLPTRGETIWYG